MEFEKLVRAAAQDSSELSLETYGQHNIGIRLQREDGLTIHTRGPAGQRLGCMGMPGTTIICDGAASDDVGYLNIGAEITVKGDATNGVCNAMANGKVYIAGSIGARGLTMTKWNPDYERPELWVLGSTGDSFAEFNCGGIAVVCGVEAKTEDNVLGYRPCVGMVGGTIFFRGKIDDSYPKTNAVCEPPNDEQWEWLSDNIPAFLTKIERKELQETLLVRDEWRILRAITPAERALMFSGPMPMAEFRHKFWDKAFGGGDPLRDLAPGLDRTPIDAIVSGDLRRQKPYWANREYAAPCTYYCPIHIPTVDRLRLIREGRIEQAYKLVLHHTPLPGSVCGAICPNLCMDNCSRCGVDESIEMQVLGRAASCKETPEMAPLNGKKAAIIGGGPGGINTAWQLVQAGIESHIYEKAGQLGGKLSQAIPWDRLPQAIWDEEIRRFTETPGINVHLNVDMTTEEFNKLRAEYDYVVIAVGTHNPRVLQFPGNERVIPALDFLKKGKSDGTATVGKEVVVIGAGNVGCDVACEAYRLGAEKVTLVDIQKPLSFGVERERAEKLGATFVWPINTREVTDQGLIATDGTFLPAQTVIISIGDVPTMPFLPDDIEVLSVAGGKWVKTSKSHQTSDPKIYAIGDVEKPGLATNAMGAGKEAAEAIIADSQGVEWKPFDKQVITQSALTITHYVPEPKPSTEEGQAERCLSCGSCRDCHLCETICPTNAISRIPLKEPVTVAGSPIRVDYEYVSDDKKCIACGFCADTCPCGIWTMTPN